MDFDEHNYEKELSENVILPPQYDYFTEDGNLICQLCGKVFKSMTTQHLMKYHGIDLATYKEKYPEAPLSSKNKIEKQKQSYRENMLKTIKKDMIQTHIIIDEEIDETDESINLEDYSFDDNNAVKEIDESINLEDYSFDDNNTVKEISKPKLITNQNDPLIKIKNRIINNLKEYFPNIKCDYFIEKKSKIGNSLIYSLITDFADPIKKVIIDFPNSFFHNQGRLNDNSKYSILENDGWKIILIKSNEDLISKIKSEF